MCAIPKLYFLCLPELELFSGDLDDSLNFLLFFGSGDFEGLLRFLGDGDFEGLLRLLASSRWCFSVRAKCLLSLQNIRGGRVSSTQQKLFGYKGEIEMPPVFFGILSSQRLGYFWSDDLMKLLNQSQNVTWQVIWVSQSSDELIDSGVVKYWDGTSVILV